MKLNKILCNFNVEWYIKSQRNLNHTGIVQICADGKKDEIQVSNHMKRRLKAIRFILMNNTSFYIVLIYPSTLFLMILMYKLRFILISMSVYDLYI